jgi:sigma-54 specific flagellar transcriptional regulator A
LRRGGLSPAAPPRCKPARKNSPATPFASAPHAKTPAPGRPIDLKREIETIELEQIYVALDLADGIISEAARLLTLKRTTLIEKMRKYGVHQQAA